MTRIRKWLLTASMTLALVLSLGTVASADPGDPGGTTSSTSTTTQPGRGTSPWTTTTTSTDPGDPGGTTY